MTLDAYGSFISKHEAARAGNKKSPIMQFDIRATQSVNKKYPVPVLSFAWPYKLVAHFPAWHYKTVDVLINLSLKILRGANETQEGGEGKLALFVSALLQSFRFEDEDNYEYEI